jgi:hypothetical protein
VSDHIRRSANSFGCRVQTGLYRSSSRQLAGGATLHTGKPQQRLSPCWLTNAARFAGSVMALAVGPSGHRLIVKPVKFIDGGLPAGRHAVSGAVKNTIRKFPIPISSPLVSTAESICCPLT